MSKFLFIFGTRPEAIKLAPLIIKCRQTQPDIQIRVCVTAQHRQMLDQVLDFFEIQADFDLGLMSPNQSIFDITGKGLLKLEEAIKKISPDYVFVQGDTTTAFIGALAGFYLKHKVIHIEAGLRSFHKFSPFPEEINRKLVGVLADLHFAPTEKAKANLLVEGISNNVYVVGNTVIDALLLGLQMIHKGDQEVYHNFFKFVDFSKKIILVTGHRRESFGDPFLNICHALKEIAKEFSTQVEIIYPVHLNPNVQKPVLEILKNQENIHLIDPLGYPFLVWLMNKCYLVLTDSGGIQEEAPSLAKPVLVMRDVTEREEGIDAGVAKLVGTTQHTIFNETKKLLLDSDAYLRMANKKSPFGDGRSSELILNTILDRRDH